MQLTPNPGGGSDTGRLREASAPTRDLCRRNARARWRGAIAVAFACVAASATAVRGQVVRGRVTERNSSEPLSGVVVVLERPGATASAAGTMVANALSNESGEYAIRAPGAGEYRVSAKRIGVQRHVSAPFALGASETRRLDITLDPVTHRLPTVAVSGTTLCFSRPAQAQRIVSLWEEVRTALEATRISMRDRRIVVAVYRYVREFDAQGKRLFSENRSEYSGVIERPFRSVSADSLSRFGFWRTQKNYTEYNVPDADVLLSPIFIDNHCFALQDNRRDHRGLLGLSFEPRRERDVADVTGTLWVDSATFELRSLDYGYTKLPSAANNSSTGGEVRFARVPNGTWIVRQWYVRMPQFASVVSMEGRLRPGAAIATPRQSVYRIVEEGGNVFTAGTRLYRRPATILGLVNDSLGRPLRAGRVRLGGSPFVAEVDSSGRFRFDNLPSGRYTVAAEHVDYAPFNMPAADAVIAVDEGDTLRVTMRAANAQLILDRICEDRQITRGRGALRLQFLDPVSKSPLTGLPVHLWWFYSTAGSKADGVQGLTDSRGVMTFCDVPAGKILLVRALRPDLKPGPIVAKCTVRDREVAARMVFAEAPQVEAAGGFSADSLARIALCEAFRVFPDTSKRVLPGARGSGTAGAQPDALAGLFRGLAVR